MYVFMYELEYMIFYNRAHWIPSIPPTLTICLLEKSVILPPPV